MAVVLTGSSPDPLIPSMVATSGRFLGEARTLPDDFRTFLISDHPSPVDSARTSTIDRRPHLQQAAPVRSSLMPAWNLPDPGPQRGQSIPIHPMRTCRWDPPSLTGTLFDLRKSTIDMAHFFFATRFS